MNFPSQIKTERLILEKPENITFQLAEEIYDIVEKSREHLKIFLPWARTMLSAEEEFMYLKNYAETRWFEKTGFCYLVYHRDSQKFLGVIDLIHINEKHKSAEIGFWLGVHATGQGYMLEAVKALEKEAFAQGFHRIVIANDVRNIKSANVAKNAGYHLDGIMRENKFDEETGEFNSLNIWAKLATDLK